MAEECSKHSTFQTAELYPIIIPQKTVCVLWKTTVIISQIFAVWAAKRHDVPKALSLRMLTSQVQRFTKQTGIYYFNYISGSLEQAT